MEILHLRNVIVIRKAAEAVELILLPHPVQAARNCRRNSRPSEWGLAMILRCKISERPLSATGRSRQLGCLGVRLHPDLRTCRCEAANRRFVPEGAITHCERKERPPRNGLFMSTEIVALLASSSERPAALRITSMTGSGWESMMT